MASDYISKKGYQILLKLQRPYTSFGLGMLLKNADCDSEDLG